MFSNRYNCFSLLPKGFIHSWIGFKLISLLFIGITWLCFAMKRSWTYHLYVCKDLSRIPCLVLSPAFCIMEADFYIKLGHLTSRSESCLWRPGFWFIYIIKCFSFDLFKAFSLVTKNIVRVMLLWHAYRNRVSTKVQVHVL